MVALIKGRQTARLVTYRRVTVLTSSGGVSPGMVSGWLKRSSSSSVSVGGEGTGVDHRIPQVQPVRPDLQGEQHQLVPRRQPMLPGQRDHPTKARRRRRLPGRRPPVGRERLRVDTGRVPGHHCLTELQQAAAELLEDPGGDAFAFAGQAEE